MKKAKTKRREEKKKEFENLIGVGIMASVALAAVFLALAVRDLFSSMMVFYSKNEISNEFWLSLIEVIFGGMFALLAYLKSLVK